MPKIKIKKAPQAKNGKLIPLSHDMQLFQGASHENGGIPYKGVEVEGGEPLYQNVDGSQTVFGNMYVPGTKQKFKEVAKTLAKKDKKVQKFIKKGNEALDSLGERDNLDKWDRMKQNAGIAMLEGGALKSIELKQSKEHLATLQQALLQSADEMGADPFQLSKGKVIKAKNGVKLKYDDGGKWDYRGTNKEGLDQKIREFVDLVAKKGYKGYSGPKGGVNQRNTKSGRKSRHASGQALDMIFDDPDVYQKILKDPELTGFLINNGLTAINEYDAGVKSKTGADVGHIHIGYDQGTSLSDSFRNEAKKLYGQSNTDWAWNRRVKGGGKAIKNAPSGDAQLGGYDNPVLNIFKPGKTKGGYNPRTVDAPDYSLDVNNPGGKNLPSNAKGLDWYQIAPELVAFAQNKVQPVWMQQYNPQLFQPTQVSFQDRLNENQTSFNALSRIMGDNPAALATLAGQKYSADNAVRGEEFRTNQQIEEDVVNKNINLLNDAQLKNIGLADTQFTRQEQAKANTRILNNNILNSITGKIAQNDARNQALKYYESLTDYRYNPETGQVEYMGDNMAQYLPTDGSSTPGVGSNTSMKKVTDKNGDIKSTTYTTPSQIDTAIKVQQLQQGNYKRLQQILGEKGSVVKMFNTYKK